MLQKISGNDLDQWFSIDEEKGIPQICTQLLSTWFMYLLHYLTGSRSVALRTSEAPQHPDGWGFQLVPELLVQTLELFEELFWAFTFWRAAKSRDVNTFPFFFFFLICACVCLHVRLRVSVNQIIAYVGKQFSWKPILLMKMQPKLLPTNLQSKKCEQMLRLIVYAFACTCAFTCMCHVRVHLYAYVCRYLHVFGHVRACKLWERGRGSAPLKSNKI